MKISDFDLYKDLLKKRSGLILNEDKSYLLDSRLSPVAKKWGFANLETMTMTMRGMPDPKLVKDVVEAMTTNETSFFRDTRPFDIFEKVVVPYLREKGKRKSIRIWSAACSSGQEPYSLAMILEEKKSELGGLKFEIIATDISDEILETAQNGLYSQFEVQRGLPIQMLMKYFEQQPENKWQLKSELRNKITFKNFNLLDSMNMMGTFDIIFCRNVLIYFDESTKRDILERMVPLLADDGFLFLGGAETVIGITDKFAPKSEHRGLYIKKDGKYEWD